ncbi:MAG: patatin-like phospholipase family protein [Bacteroidota bacterium]
MSFPFDNLFLHGGGVKGMAFTGALSALQKANALEGIHQVAGVSGGALIAFLYSLGFSPDELTRRFQKTDLRLFEDDWDPFRIVSEYGLYRGQYLLNWLKDRLKEKGYAPDSTFAHLQETYCCDLIIYASDMAQQQIKSFSFGASPQVSVAEAVRASISIPLFFHAWQFSNQIPDDHLYADGAIFTQAALRHFTQQQTGNTLLLYLQSSPHHQLSLGLQTNEIYQYTSALFDSLLRAQLNQDFCLPVDCQKIAINDFGFAANYFKILPSEKQQLVTAGRRATQQFLDDHLLGTPD